MAHTSNDWFVDLGLAGSETVISAFVARMLETQADMRRWLLEKAIEAQHPVEADEAQADDWRAAREWFVAGAGNVDVLLRNRRLGWTFLVEHKVTTTLSDQQIKKYVDAVEFARTAARGAPELVVPCFLSPSGKPTPTDELHDPTVKTAVRLDYDSFVARARTLPAVVGSPAFLRCLDEMDALASPRGTTSGAAGNASKQRDDLRWKLLDLVAAQIPGATRVGFEVRLPDKRRVRVPHGPRQCVSVLAASDSSGRNISVPWPEPGLDAPWWQSDQANELIAEQARIIFATLGWPPPRTEL